METKVNYALVGVFVIALLAAIILVIIWLSSDFFTTGDFAYYKVYMKESVSGLASDASVEYNGVNVGSVCDIEINQQNPRLVELLLKVKEHTPITEGTKAKLDSRALTGIAFI